MAESARVPNARRINRQAVHPQARSPKKPQSADRNRPEQEADTRTRLLEAAGPVFAAQGFDRATVREICAAAGVNVAAVGYHFGDKLGLYRAVIQGIRDSRERRFPTPNNEGSDPRRTLYRIIHTLLSRMLSCDESGWETQLLMREMQRPTPVFESMVREFFRPQFDRLVSTIRDLAGPSVPKHRLEQLALSVVGQCIYYRMGSGIIQVLIPEEELEQHFDIDSLSRHITTVMLAATAGGTAMSHDDALIQRLADH
jgi:AcrR family transcriptional regulator